MRERVAAAPNCSPTWTRSNRRLRDVAGVATPSHSSQASAARCRRRARRRAIERGKAEFDRIRALFDAPERAPHDGARARASRSSTTCATGATGAGDRHGRRVLRSRSSLLALLVRSAVTRPLATLAAACRRITEGNFGENASCRAGPKDIRAIAADVENMRQRIVEELEASRAARAALDEQAEELRRSNAELEQFAYVASHDLQEPLRKVASFCQLLEKRYGDQLDERGIEYIAFAVDGAKRMQVLINDLLTFSRVGPAQRHPHRRRPRRRRWTPRWATSRRPIEESGAEIERPGSRCRRSTATRRC